MIRSLVLCVVFCRSVILSLIFWSLCDLSFADLRICITPFGIFKLFLYLLWEIWNKVCWYVFEFWIKIWLKEKKTFDTNLLRERYGDTKGVILWCKSKKDRQYNGQKKTGLWNRCTKHSTGNIRLSNTKRVNLVLWKGRQFLNHYW